MSFNQPRSPLARLALAAGGIAVLTGLAKAEQVIAGTIGGSRGLQVAAALAFLVFSLCSLGAAWRQWKPRLTKPAPVWLPERHADDLEPLEAR